MVFKSFTLARQSLAKGFTHGYAQSVVASVTQQNPLASFNHDRLRKAGAKQNQHAFASTSTASALKALGVADSQDSGLAAYYAAWQKHRNVDDKEWSQFQFRKLIEWKPQSASSKTLAEHEDSAIIEDVDEDLETLPAHSGVNRAYSTSQVDDFRKVVGDEKVEEIALAQVDEAIAQEAAKIQALHEASRSGTPRSATPIEKETASVENIRSRSVSPATVSDTLVNSTTLSRTDSTTLYSPIETLEP